MRLPRYIDDRPSRLSLVVLACLVSYSFHLQLQRAAAGFQLAVLIGGTLLLLAGSHERMACFLHLRVRHVLCSCPISASQHWRDAIIRHATELAYTWFAGVAAILCVVAIDSTPPETLSIRDPLLASLALWSYLVALVVCTEPFAGAIASALGRKVHEGSAAREWQQWLSGGWTLPESAIHLYTPALGLGLAIITALPLEITATQLVNHPEHAVPHAATWFIAIPLVIACIARVVAPHLYQLGYFAAVPSLHETLRTLRGTPIPEPAPAILQRLGPSTRLSLLVVYRTVPFFTGRIVAMAVAAIWASISGSKSLVPWLALSLLLLTWWTHLARTKVHVSTLEREIRLTPIKLVRPRTIIATIAAAPSFFFLLAYLYTLAAT